MKRLKLFLILFVIQACTSKETTITTYYFIRHAEKDQTDIQNKDPYLNDKGLERAKKWANVFSKVNFEAIYATNYNRTKQTATPTAISKKLEVLQYDPRNLFDASFQRKTKGKTVLVVGHSNTTPQFVNKILGQEKYSTINEDNNANLYIVTLVNNTKNSSVLYID